MSLVAERSRERARTIDWESFLRRHPLFLGLAEAELLRLVASAEELTLRRDDVVDEQGPAHRVFLVGMGSLRVSISPPGCSAVELTTLRKGEYFGESALFDRESTRFDPSPEAARVVALRDSVLLALPVEALRELVSAHPELGLAFLLTLTERLRDANERIVSMKLGSGDAALKLLEARLGAEVRVFEAALKAAYAVFEQTKVRTDEVISSADRSRSRFASVASTVVTVFTVAGVLLGGIGIREVWSLREMRSEIEQVRKDAQDIAAIRKTTAEAKEILAREQILPGLLNALTRGIPFDAKNYFEKLEELDWLNDDRIVRLLAEVEVALVAPREASGSVAAPALPALKERQDFTPLLGKILEHAKDPETRAKAFSLLLANAILADTKVIEGPSGGEPKVVQARFVEFLGQHRGRKLLGKEDWSALEERLRREGPDKLEAFEQQVKAAIPKG